MSEFDASAIPADLANRPQWICWKEVERDGDVTKIPMRPDGPDKAAKTNDIATWGTFGDAVETAQRKGWGIGFVFSDADPYLGIDLDGCLDSLESPSDWLPSLEPFVRSTYIERSPSGAGLHIILKDSVPDWWTNQERDTDEGHHEGVELYDNGRFFTFTGDQIEVSAKSVSADIDLQPWLETVWEEFNDDGPPHKRGSSGSEEAGDTDIDLGIHDIIPRSQYSRGERQAHPFHGSDTGANFMVDEGDETFRCWRHNVTGNAHHLLAMEQGVVECGEWAGTGLDGETWRDVYDLAREDGYDIPEPTRRKPQRDDPTETDRDIDPTLSLQEKILDQVLYPLYPDRYDLDGEIDEITHDTAVDRVARIFTDHYDFVRPREDTRGWRDCLYVYADEDGIYEAFGESFVQREAERLLGDFATNQRIREIVGKIERRSRVAARRLEAEPNRLVVGNGILDLTTGELDPHTPDEYHQTAISVGWNPEAECQRIDEFLHSVVDDGNVDTLYRLVAHTLYKEYTAQKAAMLLGEGSNGKSVFLSLIEEFLGEWNVSNQSLQELNEDEWAANNLVGKLANVHPDMSDQNVQTMQMFKKLTGRDMIQADVKFEEPVKFENYATLIFACNRMPVLHDDTRGNWRRWILIDFPNTFRRGDEDWQPRGELMAELTDESELEGLLARCVQEIQAWDSGRSWFPNAPDPQTTRKQIRRAAEPIYDFAHACLEDVGGDEAFVWADDMRDCYHEYASDEGLPPINKQEFGKKLLGLLDYSIDKGQKRENGRRKYAYTGVQLTPRGEQLLNSDDPGSDDAETTQKGLGSSSKNPWAVVAETLDAVYSGDNVSKAELVAHVARDSGLDIDEIDHGIEDAAQRGEIIREPADGGPVFRPS